MSDKHDRKLRRFFFGRVYNNRQKLNIEAAPNGAELRNIFRFVRSVRSAPARSFKIDTLGKGMTPISLTPIGEISSASASEIASKEIYLFGEHDSISLS